MLPVDYFDEACRVVGVRVGRFRGLSDLWVRWADRSALMGENGAGKSRLLEACAWLMGSPETLRMVAASRPALADDDDLSVVVEEFHDLMPQHRQVAQNLAQIGWPGAESDSTWWAALGASERESWIDAATSLLSADQRLALEPLLARAPLRPLVRYRLLRATSEERQFARTLVVPRRAVKPLKALLASSPLAGLWSPLEEGLARRGDNDPYVDVFELPVRHQPPVSLQWLVQPRRLHEIEEDLASVFSSSFGAVADFADHLDELLRDLPVVVPDAEGGPIRIDPDWWLTATGADSAERELTDTMPGLGLLAVQHGQIQVEARHGLLEALGSEHRGYLQLSAGEMRWVDEALATAGTAMRELGILAQTTSTLLSRVVDADLLEDLTADTSNDVIGQIERRLQEDQFWADDLLKALLDALVRPTLRSRLELIGNADSEQGWARIALSGLRLRPDRVIRVIDEPEAHLHPSAQERVAAAVDAMAVPGRADVVVASHSPRFLGLPGWGILQVRRSLDGSVRIAVVPEDDLNEAGQALGLTAGELLVNRSQIIFVEGEHDLLVLNDQFGPEISAARAVLLPLRGTHNLPSVADKSLVTEVLWDMPVSVLVDNADFKEGTRRSRTPEAMAVRRLIADLQANRRTVTPVGLDRPDVVAYLDEETIRSLYPDFPGWLAVIKRYEAEGGTAFKTWLHRTYRVRLQHTSDVRAVLDHMRRAGRRVEVPLAAVVKETLAKSR